MTDPLFGPDLGDAAPTPPGFRLQALEVLNWGTFDGRVWRLTPGGENTLLTGDIGSGKSTLVDAVTTLLLPPGRIAYNRAAGAARHERDLLSYVRGHHRTERNPSTGVARPVALRDERQVTVLLAAFRHAGLGLWVTLAQVFWCGAGGGPPERLHVTADARLTIEDHFLGFGGEIAALKRRLREAEATQLHTTYKAYKSRFCRQMGVLDPEALELFHQTVSMKAVADLTGFVRDHMLESFDAEGLVRALVDHFEDLLGAHAAVGRAREQLGALEPLVADCDDYEAGRAGADTLRAQREALAPWFAGRLAALLDERITEWRKKLAKQEGRLAKLTATLDAITQQMEETRDRIRESGGGRIDRLSREIDRLAAERDARRKRSDLFAAPLRRLGWEPPEDAAAFAATLRRVSERREGLEVDSADAQNRVTESSVAVRDAGARRDATQAELESLRTRRSNVDARQEAIRQRLLAALGVEEAQTPFAAELIRVREEEHAWEGAAERLLRPLGLCLLVPEGLYHAVVGWVDANHLGGRLVYFRVPARVQPGERPRAGTLFEKLEVKPDSPLRGFVERELARRADLVCCGDAASFRREPRAISRQGQVKSGGGRHEKDDRSRVDDRSRYILGWDNRTKIGLLEARLDEDAKRLGAREAELRRGRERNAALQREAEALAQLSGVSGFTDLDWRDAEAHRGAAAAEKRELETASDVLASLTDRLAELSERRDSLEGQRGPLFNQVAESGFRIREDEKKREDAAERAAQEQQALGGHADALAAFVEGTLTGGMAGLKVDNLPRRESEVRSAYQSAIDREDSRLDRIKQRVVRRMSEYRQAHPGQTQELDASVEAASGYRGLLSTLRDDDLPRFEERFKRMLHENTIQEVAGLQAELDRRRQTIEDRIDRINRSLRGIDYNPGRFVRIEASRTQESEVRDFRERLRACTTHSLTPEASDGYSEEKFEEVRSLIERFRGREGEAEADRRWTQRVTDVRNWFGFAASERWRETDEEHEHYADSGGKSGGQKEKLAYTILGASLAYRFNLERSGPEEKTFRFVMIDEAFGRGSDESAEFGLNLFRRLGLQLLIVTPLQKIRAIEPFVPSVAFVDNPGGSGSRLRNLTIRAFRRERDAAEAATPEQPL